jgi:uncharacterized membrane protein
MAERAGISGLETTQDERTMASLAHALSFLGFIPPLVIFLVKRPSRFVSFHALQALLWHVTYLLIAIGLVMVWVCTMVLTITHTVATKGAAPPLAIFAVFPLVWLGFMGAWVVTLILAVMYCIKASQGEWADYPVLGAMARKMLKMGPSGAGIA